MRILKTHKLSGQALEAAREMKMLEDSTLQKMRDLDDEYKTRRQSIVDAHNRQAREIAPRIVEPYGVDPEDLIDPQGPWIVDARYVLTSGDAYLNELSIDATFPDPDVVAGRHPSPQSIQ